MSIALHWEAICNHARQRGYLRLANWIIRAARSLAAQGLLGSGAARTAFGWSERLSKKSLAIWRSEHGEAKVDRP